MTRILQDRFAAITPNNLIHRFHHLVVGKVFAKIQAERVPEQFERMPKASAKVLPQPPFCLLKFHQTNQMFGCSGCSITCCARTEALHKCNIVTGKDSMHTYSAISGFYLSNSCGIPFTRRSITPNQQRISKLSAGYMPKIKGRQQPSGFQVLLKVNVCLGNIYFWN